jgi:hypothetical protein
MELSISILSLKTFSIVLTMGKLYSLISDYQLLLNKELALKHKLDLEALQSFVGSKWLGFFTIRKFIN